MWDVECLVELRVPKGWIRCRERSKERKAHLAFHGKGALLDARSFDVDLYTIISSHVDRGRWTDTRCAREARDWPLADAARCVDRGCVRLFDPWLAYDVHGEPLRRLDVAARVFLLLRARKAAEREERRIWRDLFKASAEIEPRKED